MMLATTKRTTKVDPLRVPRVSKKSNLTLATVDGTVCQIDRFAQGSIERLLILTNERKCAILLVPIVAKLEEFRDADYKNARFSVTISSVMFKSSSYHVNAYASTGRARIFHARTQKTVT